jgi:hypothetical protein
MRSITRDWNGQDSQKRFFQDGNNALILGLVLQTFLLLFCVFFSTSSVVEAAAAYIYADAQSDYLSGVFVGLFLTITIFLWPVASRDKLSLMLLWQAKLIVTLVLMLFYEAYFIDLDAFAYFNTAVVEQLELVGLAIGDGSNNVSELCKLLMMVLPESYHMLKVIFSYIGLIGIYVFYRAISLAIGSQKLGWLLGLGLFPSILFWSSILGKDPVSFLGIGIACFGIVTISKKRLLAGLLYFGVGLLLVAYIRIWMSLILLAPAGLVIALSVKSKLTRILLAFVSLGVAVLLLSVFNDRFEIESRRDAVERYDTLSRNWSDMGGSSQAIAADLTDPIQLLAFAPAAGFTALFRPLPFEILSVFGTLSGVENFLLLVLFFRALIRFRLHHLRDYDYAIAAGILLLAVWVLLYGPISYQNLGTAVRFKLQILPIFLALLLAIGSKRPSANALITPALGQTNHSKPLPFIRS